MPTCDAARLLLVDGSNLLFQMFFGMPARITNARGDAIHGVLGFTGALLKIIRMTQPTHVLAVFDSEDPGERRALDPDYKANRPDYSAVPEEENPFSQISGVYAALDCLGIRHAEARGCEADDLIAAYAMHAAADTDVVISSFDSDFFQLISPRVSVLRYRGERTTIDTPQTLQAKLGITPEQYADHKAMTGDKADNLRGADGVGPKTAAALLAQYGTLEQILAHAQEIARPSVRASILCSADRLRHNQRMIRLTGGAPLPIAPDALAYTDAGMTTGSVLRAIGLR
ncbi:MAG: 5'-3' exonuclease [Clostridia bacterium]|nr:5'-3' exonuclease [Clostridia bacterium]